MADCNDDCKKVIWTYDDTFKITDVTVVSDPKDTNHDKKDDDIIAELKKKLAEYKKAHDMTPECKDKKNCHCKEGASADVTENTPVKYAWSERHEFEEVVKGKKVKVIKPVSYTATVTVALTKTTTPGTCMPNEISMAILELPDYALSIESEALASFSEDFVMGVTELIAKESGGVEAPPEQAPPEG